MMQIEKLRCTSLPGYQILKKVKKGQGCMEEISRLTYEEKEQLIMHLGRIYRKGMFQRAISMQGIVEDKEGSATDIELAGYIRVVLQKLAPQEALLLLNDFFEIKKSDWWKDKYRDEDYVRMKRYAMDEFLRCLYA